MKMKKFMSMILALVLVLALSVPVLASGEPSEEVRIEVTNEGFGSYVSYLRKFMETYESPEFDEGARSMALSELDSVGVGSDVYAFPFEMYVNAFGAMTYDEYMTSQQQGEGSAEPQTPEEFAAYVEYIRDYMKDYNGEGTGGGFDDAARDMALGELDSVGFGNNVYAFPFEMFVNEFGGATYAEFIAQGAASGEASGSAELADSWEAYLAYAEAAIRAQEEESFVDMALDSLYNESDPANPDGWPFDMFVGGRGLFVSYDEFVSGAK